MKYTCLVCGKPFTDRPSHKRVACSQACGYEGRRGRLITSIEKTCETCGKSYVTRSYRPSRFCSNACQGISDRKAKIGVTCEYCEQVFEVVPSRIGRVRFCSHACRARKLSVGVTIGVNRGRMKTPKNYGRSEYIKNAAIVRASAQGICEACGAPEKTVYRLEVHHKLPIRLSGTDNLANLELLCTKCHRSKDAKLRKA